MSATVPIPIEDPRDPRIADYRDLRDRDLRGRHGLFVAENLFVVERLLARPELAVSVLCLPSKAARVAPAVPPGVPLYTAEKAILSGIAGFPIHRGVLAIGRRPSEDALRPARAIPAREGPLTVLACEGITHPDNVGMLFRAAAAFAVDALLLDRASHDPLYRRALRLSAGHVLSLPWAWTDDLPAELARLRQERGLALVGAATQGSLPLDEAPRPERLVLVVGTESRGLRPETLALLDARVRIPMAPGIDSLNVAVAAAVCLHRLSRGERA